MKNDRYQIFRKLPFMETCCVYKARFILHNNEQHTSSSMKYFSIAMTATMAMLSISTMTVTTTNAKGLTQRLAQVKTGCCPPDCDVVMPA